MADGQFIKKQIRQQQEHELTPLCDAETVILNTCAVKNATESKMLHRIRTYKAMNKRVIVTGCLPKVNGKVLEKHNVQQVDTNSINKINSAISDGANYFSGKPFDKTKSGFLLDETNVAIIPISEGCLNRCTFCGTKNARGNLYSYSEENIIAAMQNAIQQGKTEIYLTSQDSGCYGFDKKTSLPQLVSKLIQIPGDYKIRIGMMNPHHAVKIIDPLLEVMKSDKVYKFIHVPVQSGSDRVLMEMLRGHSTNEFYEVVEKARKAFPEITIATDIIVGYPTEADADFQDTVGLIKRVKPAVMNLSKFYPRPNTAASRLKMHSTQVLAERSKTITRAFREIRQDENNMEIGAEFVVACNGEKTRLGNYRQVFLEKPAYGNHTIKIVAAGPLHLRAQVIETYI